MNRTTFTKTPAEVKLAEQLIAGNKLGEWQCLDTKLKSAESIKFVRSLTRQGVLRTWSWSIDGNEYTVRSLSGAPMLVAGEKWDAFVNQVRGTR